MWLIPSHVSRMGIQHFIQYEFSWLFKIYYFNIELVMLFYYYICQRPCIQHPSQKKFLRVYIDNISISVFVSTCYCYTAGRVLSKGTARLLCLLPIACLFFLCVFFWLIFNYFYLILFFNIKFMEKLIS
jgi:hypothetical protein